jgi:predicted butyrate kinase (DUF1464 family)
MIRVAGCDSGSSSLDILILEDRNVGDQVRFSPEQIRDAPDLPCHWLCKRGPFNLIAGPSGYGLPLVKASDCTDRDLALMSLTRPDDANRKGVLGFSSVVRAFRDSGLPVIFLPGVIQLATVPNHRKINRIDLGTADKLCVAALALENLARQVGGDLKRSTCCVVELGSAFTACVVIQNGRIVDGVGGTSGPMGWSGGGAWDGEVAYLFSPLVKRDLFESGVASIPDRAERVKLFRESLRKAVAGLRAATPFDRLYLSGRLLELEPTLSLEIARDLKDLGAAHQLNSLPNAWVKHAAQGAAVLADGLAGGELFFLVDHLRIKEARGSVLHWLRHPRGDQVRATFQ